MVVIAGAPGPVISTPSVLRNARVTRGLGITSILIGTITLGVGIAISVVNAYHWATKIGAAVWCGSWLIITGMLGVASARFPANGLLNGLNMACNIIVTVITFCDGIFFSVALAFYSTCTAWAFYGSYSYSCYKTIYYFNVFTRSVSSQAQLSFCSNTNSAGFGNVDCYRREVGLGLYSLLLLCMVIEWFVALVAAIYCCSCCGRQPLSGTIIQQPQGTSSNVFIATSSVPVGSCRSQDLAYPMHPPSYAPLPPSTLPAQATCYTVYEQSGVHSGYMIPAPQTNFPLQQQADVSSALAGSKQNMPPPYF